MSYHCPNLERCCRAAHRSQGTYPAHLGRCWGGSGVMAGTVQWVTTSNTGLPCAPRALLPHLRTHQFARKQCHTLLCLMPNGVSPGIPQIPCLLSGSWLSQALVMWSPVPWVQGENGGVLSVRCVYMYEHARGKNSVPPPERKE